MTQNDGTIHLRPGPGYALFGRAETLGMTVGKLLTGKDMPLSNMEMVLTNTFHLAKRRLERQGGKRG